MIKVAAVLALAFAKVEIKEVLEQALTEKEEMEPRRIFGITAAGLASTLSTVMATVSTYTEKGISALGVAADAKDNISTLVGKANQNRYVAVEIQNAFSAHVKLQYQNMFIDFGYAQKPCSITIKPATLGTCGISKTYKSWSGAYGVMVYRAKHGAQFATNSADYWVDFAVVFGNPQRFWHASNWFGVYVAEAGVSLTASWQLYDDMKNHRKGTKYLAQENKPVVVIKNGVRVHALMSDDYKPKLVVEVWPDTALYKSHVNAWGDLRTFYDRECYGNKLSQGMTYGSKCQAFWLHSFNDMKTAKHSYLGAQEICLKNAACHSFWWSTKRGMGLPTLANSDKSIVNFDSAESFDSREQQWSFLNNDPTRGWGVAFFGGSSCDLDQCGGKDCDFETSPAWVGGSSNQFKCRWTPTNVLAQNGRRIEEIEE